ncbi:MAG TPA: LD-carboxypeptidase [Longimicrobiaceae bacterium]|nr:LD-carboxypeptidase [Longimicrobiaceae bacterium]
MPLSKDNQRVARANDLVWRHLLIRPKAPPEDARVALVAPAGPLPEGGLARAIGRVRGLGWEPVVGLNADTRSGYLAGTDDRRLHDLNEALRSDEIDMIWMLRGGYGTMRILADVDFDSLARRPRPLVGFSDNTAVHLAAQRHGVITFHGPHPAAADLAGFSLECLRDTLRPEPAGILPHPEGAERPVALEGGVAEGPLVGGNLSLLAATVGTPYEVRAAGAILFIEEVGEPAYRIDRLLSQLLLAGALDGVAGVAVGAVSECPDTGATDVPEPSLVLHERLRHLGVPIVYGFPFGHIPRGWTLPLGVRARLDAGAATLQLLEPAVE